ncbi:MAG: energy-coupling factor transporter ATPase [Clostridia bacterium]|nr:energy-coupling factor transporter ATPase [Clostridia bacterium]
MKKLELKNVSYLYSVGTPFCKKALDDVSLSIEDNSVTGIIGHTGCGKSTLVQLFNGLLSPSEGTVLLDGEDINRKGVDGKSVRFRVGLVFQYPEYQLFEETVYADIAYGPKNMGLDKDEIDRRVKDAVRLVGLDMSCLDISPFDLSGGQKRRVAIAGIMAMEPEVLILDEPAAGLDPVGREEILGGIYSYQRTKNSTVIIVSHSMEDMARYADRLVVMNKGKICAEGSLSEIFSSPEGLADIGLDIPQITKFMLKLKSEGVNVRTDIFTVEQAKKEIMDIVGGKKNA